MKSAVVLVPKAGSSVGLHVDPASGIVAWASDWNRGIDPERILVYFEGNRYDMENLRLFRERVHCAAGRMVTRYPTLGRGFYPRSEFVAVGTYTWSDDWQVTNLTVPDPALLIEWVPTWHQELRT